jgi:excisionase family DNA binding protein
LIVKAPVVASVVATNGLIWPDPDDRAKGHRHLAVVSPAGGDPRRWVSRMTGTTRLSAVQPTPVGVIRVVEERLDGLERELAAARDALAAAEAELIAGHRQSEVGPDALTTDQVARVRGLSRSTVTGMISRRELPSVKIGGSRRVLRRDLDAYLGSLSSGGAA